MPNTDNHADQPLPIGALQRRIAELECSLRNHEKGAEQWHEIEEALRVSNRALKVLSECNQELIRTADEGDLLHSICHLLVDAGGYRLAWVGFAEQDEAKSVRPVAQVGYHEGYLENLHITWSDTARGRGPTGSAIRTGQPVISRQILTDPEFAPWREAAIAHGYASSIALPLITGDHVLGALNVYSSEPDAFSDQESALLGELANDLAYGIVTIRTREEHRRAEEEGLRLQAKLSLAQRMESLGRLAGGVAHDYNNMLSVILGYAELGLAKVDEGDSLHGDLQEILKAAARSTEITRQLLTFARQQVITPEVLDLNDTVEGMLTLLQRLIGEDIDFAWLPERGLSPVRMDPTQLDQILANLCVNARDAIAGVGKITISTRTVTVDEAERATCSGCVPGKFVLLTVSDNGCGMDETTLRTLFEPFFTTKGMEKGTGLGLATVYGIVEQNSGHIHVQSEPGKGTTFEVYLPPSEGEVVEHRKQETAAVPKGKGETLLIVEDEASILKLTQRILVSLGYRVMAAKTPTEALDLAAEHRGAISLLITDVVMPEMNGRELARRLLSFSPRMRCLYMSGYSANVIADRGILHEDVHFLRKPFSVMDVATKTREALSDPEPYGER